MARKEERLSYVTIDRFAQEKAASSKAFRKKLKRRGIALRSEVRRLSDEEILEQLRSLAPRAEALQGLDREGFRRLCEPCLSAQALLPRALAESGVRRDDPTAKTVWAHLSVLWERWLPDRPSFEMLDDWMQEGYKAMEGGDCVAACRIWLKAWEAVLAIAGARGIRSVEAFDARFLGTQSVFNWIQDLEMELGNAGREDGAFFRRRIAFCEACRERFGPGDRLVMQNMRRAIAESHWILGERDEAERLFASWLEEEPAWGWGWIAWADCYGLETSPPDFDRALEILRKGLEVKGLEDRPDVLERLADFYEEMGREEDAARVRRERDRSAGKAGDLAPREEAVEPVRSAGAEPAPKKIGRNAPCPCGSGLKYKKCCGKGRA